MNEIDIQQELVDRLAEQFADECRRGQQPSANDYADRHPSVAEKLREVLPPIALIEQLKRSRRPAAPVAAEMRPERIGDYRILREVGRGGMGIVYEARQESLDRRVALKVLPRHSLLDPKRHARFRTEAQAAARLHHTNIVPVFGLFESDGLFYYAMQFIEGQALNDVLAALKQGQAARDTKGNHKLTTSPGGDAVHVDRPAATASPATVGRPGTVGPDGITRAASADSKKPPRLPTAASRPAASPASSPQLPLATPGTPALLPQTVGQRPVRSYWDQVAAIGAQVAEALQYAHDQNILHRDIKPANLLVDPHGTVWVTDFGLAKILEHDNLTNTGDVIGTLQYMAPESIQGKYDVRSDVYSLGLTLYELLTLEAPFNESNPAKLLRLVSEQEPPRPRRLNPAIPRDLETIVLKAISREPAHRYPSARALSDDLRRFLDDRPILARRVAPLERAVRWCRRNRALAALEAVALGSLLLAAVVGWLGYASTTRALDSESQRRLEADLATDRADANVQLSLAALQNIFAALSEQQQLPPPEGAGPPRRAGPAEPPGRADRALRGPPNDEPGDGLFRLLHEAGREPPRPNPPAAGDKVEAGLLQTVLEFYERFAEQNATDPKLKFEAGEAYARVADAQARLGENEKALAAHRRAIAVFAALEQEFPAEPRYPLALVRAELHWAGRALLAADFDQSRLHAQAAAGAAAERAARNPAASGFAAAEYVELEVQAQRLLAVVAQRSDQPADAESHYHNAAHLQEQLLGESGAAPRRIDRWLDELADLDRGLVSLLLTQNRPRDAQAVVEHSIAVLADRGPGGRGGELLSGQYQQLAEVLTLLGETTAAGEAKTKADELHRTRRAAPPRGGDARPRAGDPPPREPTPRDRAPRPDPQRPDDPPPQRR